MQQKSILLLASLLLFISCENFLDVKPLGNAMEGDLQTGSLEGKAFGLYANFRGNGNNDAYGGMTGLPLAFIAGIRSDDADKGYDESNTRIYKSRGDDYQYDANDTWLVQQYWSDHYKFIVECNQLIYFADSLKLTDQPSVINVAEAKFFRAYAYFDLVRTFGEVPLNLIASSGFGSGNIPKSSIDAVYTQIDSDLAFASEHLPVKSYWETNYPGRLTNAAANTLAAKAKLYRRDWAGALARSEAVIVLAEYALYNSYAGLFTEAGELSSESILEIQNYVNENGSVAVFGPYTERTGIRGTGIFDQGWGWHTPSQSLVNAYEPGDPRKEGTILFRGGTDGYGNTLPESLELPYWNRKTYGDPARARKTNYRKAIWLNVPILRYADVLLMAAEAANELGGETNTTKALGYLEQVRARARGSNSTILPPVTTTVQSELRAAIKHERRVEFGMEFERFYDLVRWGDALQVLGPLGYTERCRYYPIPNAVIQQSNGVITQNPEW
jgi:starch-binding outer membrane protein, SusD/RagB family